MTTKRPNHEGGFSLVELMVAMLIGLFLTGGLVYTYVGSKRSYSFNEAMARIQENGRFAIHFLTRDLREAGYMSCAQNVGHFRNTLNNPNAYLVDFDTGLEGADDVAATWTPPLSMGPVPITGTDVITVRMATADPVKVETIMGSSSAAIDVDSANDFKDGDILLITDCRDASIFQVSSFSGSGDINHATVGGTPGNDTDDLGTVFDDSSHVMHVSTTTYFIAASNYGPMPSLWRKVIDDGNVDDNGDSNLTNDDSAAEELVLGVQDIQILYGEDTNGDRTADHYVDATSVTDMDNVVSVRIALLMTSLHEVAQQAVSYTYPTYGFGNYNDRYLRRVFVATVNLRNRTS